MSDIDAREWLNALVRVYARAGRLQLDSAAATAREELKSILSSALKGYPNVTASLPSLHLYIGWRVRHGAALQQLGEVTLIGMLNRSDSALLALLERRGASDSSELRSLVGDSPRWWCGYCMDDGCNNCVTDAEELAVFRTYATGMRR